MSGFKPTQMGPCPKPTPKPKPPGWCLGRFTPTHAQTPVLYPTALNVSHIISLLIFLLYKKDFFFPEKDRDSYLVKERSLEFSSFYFTRKNLFFFKDIDSYFVKERSLEFTTELI
ncbi:hypothetical protein Hanom_Chr02g00112421 [Helianthus anomalus]